LERLSREDSSRKAFMFYQGSVRLCQRFRIVSNAFLQAPGLPFADVLDEAKIREAFDAEGAWFAQDDNDVYTPALVLWAFLSQVLHADHLRSCSAAVSRVIVLCVALGRRPPSEDTGAYCRARARLSEAVLRRLTYDAAEELEQRVPADWRWCGHRVYLGDGTTLSAPDTPQNQAAWPQPSAQKPGLGFPLLRMVVLLSLATAALRGMELGPYSGKETGETALLRKMLGCLDSGDVFLGDCYFCSYFMIALLMAENKHAVLRQHQCRKTDFQLGQRLGTGDHMVVWQRPECPTWMDEATYQTIPATLSIREIEVCVETPGFRANRIIVVTTLTNAQRYTKEELARLFRLRWHIELDLRNIKITMHMDDLRGKTPDMVRKEIWMHWLAYNLIRKSMAQAALLHAKPPRQLGFAGALQAIVAAWDHATVAAPATLLELAHVQLRFMSLQKIGHRPDRVEPRAIKRRPKPHKLLTKPRKEARAELLGGAATE